MVSGPEIMDKFVGSSEKNLRAIFDNPPDVYESIRNQEHGDAIAHAVRPCNNDHIISNSIPRLCTL